MAVLPKEEASRRLGVAIRSLEDKRYRIRIGLPAVHIGRRIGFDERDIDQLIACGREKMTVKNKQRTQSHEGVELTGAGV